MSFITATHTESKNALRATGLVQYKEMCARFLCCGQSDAPIYMYFGFHRDPVVQ